MGLLRVSRAEAGARLRAEAGLTAAGDEYARALVAAGALILTIHLVQHLADGLMDPHWFFALGVVGAVGLWTTAALWPRGSERARTLVLVPLGVGLVWGGLAMHLADTIEDGLTLTHATGVLAGLDGVALLALAVSRFAGGRSAPRGAGSPRRGS